MPNASRNDPLGFAKRTLKNLDYVDSATDPESSVPKVHLVTQIVNSMLGLMVFPHAIYLHPNSESLLKKLEDIRLDESDIADKWAITEDTYEEQCETLGVLIWHIRNGASHRRVQFSSDSLDPSSVRVYVQDQKKRKGRPLERWTAQSRADHLHVFCRDFVELLEEFRLRLY